MSGSVSTEDFAADARAWLAQNARPMVDPGAADDVEQDVSVFKDLEHEAERAVIEAEARWQATKFEAGFGALSWPLEHGGRGLDHRYEAAFAAEEARYDVPRGHELLLVTVKLVAPTVRVFGTDDQKNRIMPQLVRADALCCQLFSEPGAGSDLASLATRARQGEDGTWRVHGQKIWSSGAHFADYGLLLARTDPDVVKHAGITAFLIPMDLPGIEVRPIRQMSGGHSFCEVFLDDVEIDDAMRLGEVGDGWSVALTVLGFERESSDGSGGVGGTWDHVRELARRTGTDADPVIRQQLADVLVRQRLGEIAGRWDSARRAAGAELGATGSLRKLQWVGLMASISDVVAEILGDRLTADTGELNTYSWNSHVLGALGYSIAGGSDQIQRNIIAERLIGLPAEPRVDRGPWKDVPR